MSRIRIGHWAVGLALVLGASIQGSRSAQAQANASGVLVDAKGVLTRQVFNDPTGQLTRQRVEAARAALKPELAAKSALRKVSLNRLEAVVAQAAAENRPLTNEIKHLAGLTRIEYVFFYPDSNDIVVAGPAEGWGEDLTGRVRGLQSGRPTLLLEDLVVALRAYPPGKNDGPVIGCSIDPTAEGLSRLQKFLATYRPNSPSEAPFIVESIRTAMGLMNITVNGISPRTHFAVTLVEADYRMKLIGIGLEKPPVKLASFVDRANPTAVSRNALQRWYFTPDYEAVRVSEDQLGMQLVGEGVKLLGEDELIAANGQRSGTGSSNVASQQFTASFTKIYPELAAKSPIFAQLRNLIDMSIVAAFIQQHGYYQKAGWNLGAFADEEKYPVERYNAPQQVETVVTSVWKGSRLMTPLGGGVQIQAQLALASANLLDDEGGKVQAKRAELKPNLAAGQWWWD